MASGTFTVADSDFKKLKNFIEENSGWTLAHKLDNILLWTKKSEVSPFNMIKVFLIFNSLFLIIIFFFANNKSNRINLCY